MLFLALIYFVVIASGFRGTPIERLLTPLSNSWNLDVVIPGVAIGWSVLLLVVTALVILDSTLKARAGKTRQLATGVFVVKLASIPFFLLNFAAWGTVAGVGLALGGVGVFVIAIAVPLTWFTMLSTSIYGWASIVRLRREGRLNTVMAWVYAILLGVFVVDMVIGVVLFAQSRRRPELIEPASA